MPEQKQAALYQQQPALKKGDAGSVPTVLSLLHEKNIEEEINSSAKNETDFILIFFSAGFKVVGSLPKGMIYV